MLEDHGHSIEGMDDPQAVREALTQITEPVGTIGAGERWTIRR